MALPRFFLLNTGAKMPSIGLGTYLSKKMVAAEAVDHAIDVGYRHIDTAHSYKNESEIGDVIQEKINTGKVKREDLFITTKVPPVHLDAPDIEPCVLESLERLQTNYVDMLLIHSPWGLQNTGEKDLQAPASDGKLEFAHHDLKAAWKAFEGLVEKGYTKAIGVSNFTTKQIDTLWNTATIKPSNVQLECNAYCQQNELRKYCQQKGIVVTGYCPVGAPGRPDRHRNPNDPVLLFDPVVRDIANKMHKKPGQIVISFLLHLGVAPLPKSTTKHRIGDNLEAYKIKLSQGDMVRLQGINRNVKFFRFPWFEHHPEYFRGQPF